METKEKQTYTLDIGKYLSINNQIVGTLLHIILQTLPKEQMKRPEVMEDLIKLTELLDQAVIPQKVN